MQSRLSVGAVLVSLDGGLSTLLTLAAVRCMSCSPGRPSVTRGKPCPPRYWRGTRRQACAELNFEEAVSSPVISQPIWSAEMLLNGGATPTGGPRSRRLLTHQQCGISHYLPFVLLHLPSTSWHH
jgi:hypothetical protein